MRFHVGVTLRPKQIIAIVGALIGVLGVLVSSGVIPT